MKKFAYSLEQVLRYKERKKEECRQRLSNAENAVLRQNEIISCLNDTIKEASLMKQFGSAIEFLRNREQYVRRLRITQMRAQAKLKELKLLEEEIRTELIEASREVQRMEKVKAREFSRWQLKVKREEQNVLDETCTTRTFINANQRS